MSLIIEAQQTAQRLFSALTEQILAARKRAEDRQRKAAASPPGKPAQAGGAPPADGRPRVQRPRDGAGGVRGYQPPRPAAQRGGYPIAQVIEEYVEATQRVTFRPVDGGAGLSFVIPAPESSGAAPQLPTLADALPDIANDLISFNGLELFARDDSGAVVDAVLAFLVSVDAAPDPLRFTDPWPPAETQRFTASGDASFFSFQDRRAVFPAGKKVGIIHSVLQKTTVQLPTSAEYCWVRVVYVSGIVENPPGSGNFEPTPGYPGTYYGGYTSKLSESGGSRTIEGVDHRAFVFNDSGIRQISVPSELADAMISYYESADWFESGDPSFPASLRDNLVAQYGITYGEGSPRA